MGAYDALRRIFGCAGYFCVGGGCCAVIVSLGRGDGVAVRACVLRFRGALIGGRARSGFLSGAGVRRCLRRLRRARASEPFSRACIFGAYRVGLRSGGSRCLFPLCVIRLRDAVSASPSFYSSPPPPPSPSAAPSCLWCLFLLWVFGHSHRFASLFLFSFSCHSTFSDADDMSVFCRVITTSALSRTARAPRRRPRLRRTTGTRTTSTMLRALMLSPAMIVMVCPRLFQKVFIS